MPKLMVSLFRCLEMFMMLKTDVIVDRQVHFKGICVVVEFNGHVLCCIITCMIVNMVGSDSHYWFYIKCIVLCKTL